MLRPDMSGTHIADQLTLEAQWATELSPAANCHQQECKEHST